MEENTSDLTEDAAVERVMLELAALRGLMEGSDEATTDRLRNRLLASDDEVLRHLVSPPETYRPRRPLGDFLIGAGELILSAFLVIMGLILIVPSILGFESRGDFAQYLANIALGLSSSGLSDPLVSALGFGLALFLLLAALYTLGHASRNLERSGFIVPRT